MSNPLHTAVHEVKEVRLCAFHSYGYGHTEGVNLGGQRQAGAW